MIISKRSCYVRDDSCAGDVLKYDELNRQQYVRLLPI